MSQTLRTAQPLLEEKQLMLISAMAQQSCFTARNYFVQPQLIHSCCACWRWVPAAAQVLAPCSDPSGAEPRAGSRGRDRSGKNLTWAVAQVEPCAEDKLSSSCGCFLVQAAWTLAVQTYCCPPVTATVLQVWGRTLNYTTAQLFKFNRGKKTSNGRFSSFKWGTCPSLPIWKSDILVFSSC